MAKKVFLITARNGYTTEQCGDTVTIEELINELTDIANEIGYDTPVYYKNDNGFTYGNINFSDWDEEAGYIQQVDNDE